MNRRNFLRMSAAFFGAATIAGACGPIRQAKNTPTLDGSGRFSSWISKPKPTPKPPPDPREVYDFLTMLRSPRALLPEGALEIVLKADILADALETVSPKQFRTLEEAQLFVWEVSPYAVYERILPEETNYGGEAPGARAMLPTRENIVGVTMAHYGGDASFHIAGSAPCHDTGMPFYINIRYFNPMSPLYHKKSSQIATLIHETMHMQEICSVEAKGDEYNSEVEAATQIATFEVLAAMTRHGNVYGLAPFVRELQSYAADVVYLWALDHNAIDFYRQEVLEEVSNDAYRLASFEKSYDHWMETYNLKFRLKHILLNYGVKPYNYIIEALNDPKLETRRLPFPKRTGRIKLNDSAYVLGHLYDLYLDYPKLLQRDK